MASVESSFLHLIGCHTSAHHFPITQNLNQHNRLYIKDLSDEADKLFPVIKDTPLTFWYRTKSENDIFFQKQPWHLLARSTKTRSRETTPILHTFTFPLAPAKSVPHQGRGVRGLLGPAQAGTPHLWSTFTLRYKVPSRCPPAVIPGSLSPARSAWIQAKHTPCLSATASPQKFSR